MPDTAAVILSYKDGLETISGGVSLTGPLSVGPLAVLSFPYSLLSSSGVEAFNVPKIIGLIFKGAFNITLLFHRSRSFYSLFQ